MKRIASIDIARGLVMIIMALDHTRDFLHGWSRTHSPIDLSVTTPLIFFTRWITHFCAPAFVFLAGTSVAIQLKRSVDQRATRAWVLRRGLILIVVEFTIVNLGLSFDPQFRLLIFEVIATIGAGFILLSFLSRLPYKLLLVLTALIFFGHNLLDPGPAMAMAAPNSGVTGRILRALFLSPDLFQLSSTRIFTVAYPILPWLGIMLAGFLAGRWFDRPAAERKRLFLQTALVSVGLFIVLRVINSYGDPNPWAQQKDALFSLLSFLNVTKYPPSLLFSLLMLSGLFLVIAAAEGRDNRVTRVLLVYGRVPLFYFIIHMYIIHVILLIVDFAQGYGFSQLRFGPFQFGWPGTSGGLPIWAIYFIWLSVAGGLYPVCRWYGRYKAAHPELTYLRYL
jgi:uncharacterized membrane protein